MPPPVTRSQTKPTQKPNPAVVRAAAERREAEAAAERARAAAIAAQKAAAEAQRRAQEAQAKLQDEVKKPNADPKQVGTLRDDAVKKTQDATALAKVAEQKDLAAIDAEKKADALEQSTGATRKYSTVTELGDTDALQLSKLTKEQTSQLLGGDVPTSVAATNDAKFIAAAAQSGNGAQALDSALKAHPNDPEYGKALLEQSQPAVEADLKNQLKTDPDQAAESMKTYLSSLPDDATRAQATENLKSDVATAVSERAKTDKAGAAQLLEKLVTAAPDQPSKQALIAANADTITDIAQTYSKADANGSQPASVALQALARTGDQAGPEGMKAMTDALAKGITNPQAFSSMPNTPLHQAMGDLQKADPALASRFTPSLAKSLEPTNPEAAVPLAGQAQQAAVTNLQTSKKEFDDAKAKVEGNNKKLNEELARVGPGLTQEQKNKYIEQFRAAHKDDYDREEQTAKNLADSLKALQPSIDNPYVARVALDAAKDLSKSPSGAKAAKDWAVDVANHPDSPVAQALAKDLGGPEALKEELNDVVGKAAPNMLAEFLRETGDSDAALRKLEDEYKGLEQGDAAKTFGENLPQLKKTLEALKAGDFAALKTIGDNNPFSKSLKATGVVLAIWKCGNDVETGKPAQFLKDLASGSKDGIELLETGMKSIGKTLSEGSSTARTLESATELAGKLAKGLGVAAGALAVGIDLYKLNSGEYNGGDVTSTIGDTMATVGAAMVLTGVGAGPGGALIAVGSLMSAAGTVASQLIEEGKTKEEERALLDQVGVDPALSNALVDADRKQLEKLTNAGMSGEDVQRLFATHPEVFSNANFLRRFADAATASNLRGGDVVALADALKNDAGKYWLSELLDNEPPKVTRDYMNAWYPSARQLMTERAPCVQ